MHKLLLLITFLGIGVLLKAQSWKTLNDQFLELFNKGKYEAALRVALTAKDSAHHQFGVRHRNYAVSMNNLAEAYRETGQYEKAEELLLAAKHLLKELFGEVHPRYALGCNNLASLYEKMGQYEKAEPLYKQAIEIDKKILGEKHADYASDLSNLAGLYWQIGQYEKAEALYTRVIEIDKAVLGEEHPHFASDLNNLALLYSKMGRYTRAESLYIRAFQIEERILGTNQRPDAITINNLASLYHKRGNLPEAESLYKQAVIITKRVSGENHPDYAATINNLALVYKQTGKYDLAEPLYLRSQEIRMNVFGDAHPAYAESLNNLAHLYENMGRYTAAEQLLLQSSRIELRNMQQSFIMLSEKEKANYLKRKMALIPTNNSFLYKHRNSSPDLIISNLNQQLILKSLILSETRNLFHSANQSGDTAIKNMLELWRANKKLLTRQYSLPLAKRMNRIDSVDAATEVIEKELNRKYSPFRTQEQSRLIQFNHIRDHLGDHEAAIEFVSFRLFNNEWTDSILYAAYLLTKGNPVPVFITLFEEKQFQKLLDSAGRSAVNQVHSFYRGLGAENRVSGGALGAALYKLVWAPLEPYLKGVKKIAYSPAGKLYNVAFHVLPVDSTSVLMDKYTLQQYTSIRQVALQKLQDPDRKINSIALFGNALFTMDSTKILISGSKKENLSLGIYTPQTGDAKGSSWNELPGTAEEVKRIQILFSQNKVTTRAFTEVMASEENLKSLSGHSPQVLHIATHGFFLPEADQRNKENVLTDENVYTLAKDPLLRSGLILAGGNYAWGGKTPLEGVEDGIATAYEISQLNLSNTELVVLSACETALGDVKGSEGVYGLQRAFKMAGVKKMIVSLWQVPDKETAELMTAFYTYWLKGKTIEEAFTKAQAEMRKKYPPYYWAAFVLVE